MVTNSVLQHQYIQILSKGSVELVMLLVVKQATPMWNVNDLLAADSENMIKQIAHTKLQELNPYCVPNAWFKVDFGGCQDGIFSAACPVEPLHALGNGVIATCCRVLCDEMICSTSQKA